MVQPFQKGPRCQSCGMPMALDGGGTEADGVTGSLDFCSKCYRDGKFVEPEMNVDEMIARVQERLLAMGMTEPVVERNLMAIYGLERWRE